MTSTDYRAKYKEWDEHVKAAEQLLAEAKASVERSKRVLLDAEGLLWKAKFERRECEDMFFLQVQYEEALESAGNTASPNSGERGFEPGCGCCSGPEADRCCCSIHQDVSRGLLPHKCSLHM